MTEIESKHGVVSRQPYELYMSFVDMRNFLAMLPAERKEGVQADYVQSRMRWPHQKSSDFFICCPIIIHRCSIFIHISS